MEVFQLKKIKGSIWKDFIKVSGQERLLSEWMWL